MLKDIAINVLGAIFSCILSVILTEFHLPMETAIFIGITIFTLWIIVYVIYYFRHEIKKLTIENNKLKEQTKNRYIPSYGVLKKRSTTAILDYLIGAKHDYYISGIINNSVINTFINNPNIVESCCKKGVKIHILFYVSDNVENLDWYLKMLYGNDNPKKKIELDKQNYYSGINTINTYNIFKKLKENELLQVKRLDTPATTAFIARDIANPRGGKIQCQFYQYQTDSPYCPACQLNSTDIMFPAMREILLNMWKSASSVLSVDYIKDNNESPTIAAGDSK